MIGVDIIAGSRRSFFAIIGSIPPITFAITTVKSIVAETVRAMGNEYRSKKNILIKLRNPRTEPTNRLILSSFQNTLKMSLKESSPKTILRITMAEAWSPCCLLQPSAWNECG